MISLSPPLLRSDLFTFLSPATLQGDCYGTIDLCATSFVSKLVLPLISTSLFCQFCQIVAVTGLPGMWQIYWKCKGYLCNPTQTNTFVLFPSHTIEPQEDHALIMVRFARDCMYKSYELTKKLEVTLGPDTAELSMRFGLHSGPVTVSAHGITYWLENQVCLCTD